MDWPVARARTEIMHTGSYECDIANLTIGNAAASAVWSTANRAFYIPFTIQSVSVIRKLFCFNGTVASGNVDMGIYDAGLVRLVSIGSTAQAGTSVPQLFNITDTGIGPGNYYLALAMDGTTGTVFRSVIQSVPQGRLQGMFAQASAFPLPATATPAALPTGIVPLYGMVAGRML